MANKKTNNETVKIKLTGSLIGATKTQIKVVRALGLKKTNSTVEHQPTASIMGMVNKVQHLVEVSK